jgi:hypothetical protein
MPWIILSTTAVPAAPIKHLTRLFAAVAVAGAPGFKSTIRVFKIKNVPDTQPPTKKRRTRGMAR